MCKIFIEVNAYEGQRGGDQRRYVESMWVVKGEEGKKKIG